MPREYVGPQTYPRYDDDVSSGDFMFWKQRRTDAPVATQPTPPPPDPKSFVPLPPDMTTYDPPPPPPQSAPVAGGPTDDLGFGAFLGMGSAVPKVSYGIRYFPEADVHGQTTSLGWVSQDFSASTPIWVGDKSVLSFNAGVRNQAFEGSAFFPATGTPVPDSLWNVRFGLAYNQTFSNDWTMGLSAHVVSASDRPFGSLDEVKFGMMGTLRIPFLEHDAWILSLTYSPTSQLPFPIPGVAYQWVPSPQFQMLIGLPTAIIYRPTEDLSFSPRSGSRSRTSGPGPPIGSCPVSASISATRRPTTATTSPTGPTIRNA